MDLIHETGAVLSPMSFGQEQMWMAHRLAGGEAMNNLTIVYRLVGVLDQVALRNAITGMHHRHEILRTRYVDQGQLIGQPADVALTEVDLTYAANPAAALAELARMAVTTPLDLTTEVPVHWSLARLGTDDYALLLVSHHIAWDGWSLAILHQELSTMYRAARAGTVPELPELPVRYADFAASQRAGDAVDDDVRFWEKQLAGAAAWLRLPFDRPPGVRTEYAGGRCPTHLPAELVRQVTSLARSLGATEFMVLLAAFSTVLARYAGQDDLIIGVPTAGRDRPELEGLIGFFVTTVPIRVEVAAAPSFRALVRQVRDTTFAVMEHASVPLERIIQRVRPARQPGRQPLVQAVFQLHNAPAGPLVLDGLTVTQEQYFPPATLLDLTFSLAAAPEGLMGTCEFRTDLFEPATVDRILASFRRLLAAAVAAPDRPLDRLALLDEREYQAIARVSAGPVASYLLDDHFELVPIGVPGELFTTTDPEPPAGHDQPAVTAWQFVPNPWGPPGSRLTRTDTVAVRPRLDGAIEILGSQQDQVTVRGYRIQLNEIEAVLREYPQVAQATARLRQASAIDGGLSPGRKRYPARSTSPGLVRTKRSSGRVGLANVVNRRTSLAWLRD